MNTPLLITVIPFLLEDDTPFNLGSFFSLLNKFFLSSIFISCVANVLFFKSKKPLFIKSLLLKGFEKSLFIEIFSPFKISSSKYKLKFEIS